MKRVNLLWLLPFILLFGGLVILFGTSSSVDSAPATHIVISEIQISGASAGDEFIELYNSTSTAVDITGWRLRRETSTGGDGGNLVASLSGNIPAHGFFLITPQDKYTGSVSADQTYSVSSNPVAADNTILLYSDSGVTLVDKVGVGLGASTAEIAGTATPSAGQSVERKANSSSTSESMRAGGDDEFEGNSEDTDNNSEDFILREVSQPQNSQSNIEPDLTPTPTLEPTPTLISPTIEPTSIPTPTTEPTATPTVTVAPTITLAVSPTLIPTPATFPFLRLRLACSVQVRTIDFRFFQIKVSIPVCRLVRG